MHTQLPPSKESTHEWEGLIQHLEHPGVTFAVICSFVICVLASRRQTRIFRIQEVALEKSPEHHIHLRCDCDCHTSICVILRSQGAALVPSDLNLNWAGSAVLQIYSSPPLCLFSRTSSGISSSVIFIRGKKQRWKPAAASGQDLSNPGIQPSQQTKIWEVWAHQEIWTI